MAIGNSSTLSNVGNFRMPPPLSTPQPPDDVPMTAPDMEAPSPTILATDGTSITVGADGSVQIGTDTGAKQTAKSDKFDANLAEEWSTNDLGRLAEDIIQGIEADIQSRQNWVSTYVKGMDLLGLKIEQGSNVRNRKRNSTVVHPLLCEAVVTFQSSARAELLPASGPAKIRNDNPTPVVPVEAQGTPIEQAIDTQAGKVADTEDDLARAFETDFNHYLTVTATEFYPDTDRMLFYLGYGGTTFKKVYHCPIRRRPVSESVYLPDLIIANDATDIENAPRITHQIQMTKAQIRRLQISGFYRDVDLISPSPLPDGTNQIRQKEREMAGQSPAGSMRPQDRPFTVWECYCEIDPGEYGIEEKGAPDGLPLPYRVSIEQSSRAVLEVRRNWKQPEDDGTTTETGAGGLQAPLQKGKAAGEALAGMSLDGLGAMGMAADGADQGELPDGVTLNGRKTLKPANDDDEPNVLDQFRRKKTFVKYGLVPGFGFLDLGFLHLMGNQTRALTAAWRILIDAGMYSNFPGGMKTKGTRQTTNEITPGPGEWVEVDTGQAARIQDALMPLPYKDPSAVFIQFMDNVADGSRKLGGAVSLEVGEGRTNAPVGTIMAMIEQQTQVMAAVHKRLHTSQAEELQLLRDLFKEDPSALWKHNRNAERKWAAAAEFADMDLVPATDPNVPGQVHRIMMANVLMLLYGSNPTKFDADKVYRKVGMSIGMSDIADLFASPDAGNQAGDVQQQALVALAGQQVQNQKQADQNKHQLGMAQIQQKASDTAAKAQDAAAERESKERIKAADLTLESTRLGAEIATDHRAEQNQLLTKAADLAHSSKQSAADRQHASGLALAGHRATHNNAVHDRTHDVVMQALQPPAAPSGKIANKGLSVPKQKKP